MLFRSLGNPLKGYQGIVKDVLCGQDTASGLKVVIQLVHFDPSAPFKTAALDYYDDVVERRSANHLDLH